MRTNWFEGFFHGLALEFWRSAVTPQETERDVNFVETELSVPKGSRILDIPCGNGRHLVEFAKRGYSVTGVDLSDEFIAEARRTANTKGISVHCIRMDMRAIHFEETFDGAFCLGNSFGYMEREANAMFLKEVSRCLKPGARFIIGTGLAAESLLPGLQSRRWHRFGDIIALSENRYDALESELHTDYTFIRGGTTESGAATYCVYTVAELKRLFTNCGLSVTGLYGSRDRQPYKLADPYLFLTATKDDTNQLNL
jgi:SAM-dependent methyltransferase